MGAQGVGCVWAGSERVGSGEWVRGEWEVAARGVGSGEWVRGEWEVSA